MQRVLRGLMVRKVAVFVFLCLSVMATTANRAFGVAPNPVTFNFETSTISGFNTPYHIITADFNNDTKPDLAVTNWTGDVLIILLGDGLGNFSLVSTLATGVHPNFIAAGDFDNSGSTDLAVTNGSGSRDVTRFFNDGTGTSWTPSTLSLGNDADVSSVVAANFTPSMDSDIDLFIVKDSGIVADFYEVWKGNGSGAFTKIASANTGNLPIFAAAADFNGDGNLDIAVANYDSNSLTILLGNGDGTFSEAAGSPITVGTHPRAIATGHLNGDAHTDLAITNLGGNTVSILLGNGDGTFNAAANVASSGGVAGIVISDLDADGKSDIAVTRFNANVVSIYRGNGDGTFDPTSTDFSVGTGPFFNASGDLDKDGKPDLAITNYTSNEVTILLNRSGQCVQAPLGLVAWWSADGHPLDLIGTNDGTLVNGTTYAAGKVSQAFSFDGVDDYVEIIHNDNLNLTGALTIDAWIKPAGAGVNNGIVVMKNPLKYGLIWLPATQKLSFSMDIGGWTDYISNSVVPVNQWTHIAGSYDGSKVRVYINGVLDAEYSQTGSVAVSTGSLTLGYRTDGTPELFNGLIDEVEIFNRALEASEIQAIYHAGSAGKCKPCFQPLAGIVSWWTGDGNANDVIGSNSGTLANGATYAAGMVDQAFSFNGVDDYVEVSGTMADFGSNPFSVAFLMNSNNAGYGAYILGKSHPDGGQGWDIRLHDNRIHVVGVDGWPEQWNIQTDQVIVASQWHHVAVTATETAVEVYVDGILRGSSGRQAISSASNPFRMGYTTNFGGAPFSGLLDEVQIYNRALSAEEIAAIYAAGSSCIPEDTSPDPFYFTDQTDVPLNTLVTSDAITVTGINAPTPISIENGEYEINGSGTWTSVAGTVNNGDTVRVRQTSSSNFSTQTDSTLTIGGADSFFDVFVVVTLAADTTPDAFSFTDQTDVPLNTPIFSNVITVAGINSPSPISITGGEYSINGGAHTAAAGVVNNGDKVCIRQTSSASYNTTTDSTLTIGGVSDVFSITTVDTEMVSLSLTSANGGEIWQSGTTQTIRWEYVGNLGTYVKIELLKGGVLNKTLTSFARTSSGFYNWKIPAAQTPGADYTIRITSKTNPALTDTSDSTFTVLGPSVTLTSPNGGENWTPGATQMIQWTYAGNPGTSLKIELLKGGVFNRTITTFASTSRGYYSWKVPATQEVGADYSVRITSKTNPSCTDVSNSNFTIGGATF